MNKKSILLFGLIFIYFFIVSCSNEVSKDPIINTKVVLNTNNTNETIEFETIRIKGVLLDADNNDPISDAKLFTLTKTIPKSVRTDDNGKFNFEVIKDSIGVYKEQPIRSGWVFFISDTAGDSLEAFRKDNDLSNPLIYRIAKQKNDTYIYDLVLTNLTMYIKFSKCMMVGQRFMDTDNRTCCEGLTEVTALNNSVCDDDQILNRVCAKLNDGICGSSESYCNSHKIVKIHNKLNN